MSTKPFPILYQFSVALPKEVDQVNTRVEGEGAAAKTVTETTKVTKSVNVPVCLKRPSRVEREEADVERAVWETHFITKGILPQALLLKTYANYGGILSDDQKKEYHKLLADYDLADIELRRLLINETENKDAIEAVALRKVDLKQSIMNFQQEQAVFFNNTAESKARQKLIEWLVLHLSYVQEVKSDESLGDWKPLFVGSTTEEKLVSFDQMVEDESPIFAKSRSMLEFLATVLASSDGSVSKEEVEAFAETLRNDGEV
jgi:succinate dehydrogenase flavin-adding protein (antitoxin of CptAB toxin-antitoxin module)